MSGRATVVGGTVRAACRVSPAFVRRLSVNP
jgi:hypothetical protein